VKTWGTLTVSIVLLLSSVALAQSPTEQSASPARQIVFVCEHGAALSVVSAAYFNKAAREQHLNWHAVARGVTPQENLSVSAEAGLKKDGVPSEVVKPQAVTQADLDHADYVVTFLPLPDGLVVRSPIEKWYDVKWTPSDYGNTRDEILKHLQQLVPKLRMQRKNR
jgi:arsenate reductase (thioredoxin)